MPHGRLEHLNATSTSPPDNGGRIAAGGPDVLRPLGRAPRGGRDPALVRRRALAANDGGFELSWHGSRLLEGLGVDVAGARLRRRAFSPGCLD
jgi:hypothetical protein